ncbi:hypothetical protein B0T14DRAFT_588523 [Immersiella caudata]|uniref:Uncharacterized protein n=1 Tax=Immersiella caudata TaxID=314043 RepID=A0AA40BWR2_9PEZI|nr:hypothetical protein B0T14DRAFT_588523 [Immersiella caudata]
MRNKAATARSGSRLRHLQLHFSFLLSFLLALTVAGPDPDVCFTPNGTQLGNLFACQGSAPKAVSGMCCGLNDRCLVNGLCYQEGPKVIYRGGCLDKKWGDTCPKLCDIKMECTGQLTMLRECPDKSGSWYCGLNGKCGEGEGDRRDLKSCYLDPDEVRVGGTVEGVYAIPGLDRNYLTFWSTKSSSSTSSSSAQTHSTTPGDTPKPTTQKTTTSAHTPEPNQSPSTSQPTAASLPGSETAYAASTAPPPSASTAADPSMAQSSSSGTPSLTASDPPSAENDGRNIPIAIGSTFGSLIVVASAVLVFFYVRKRKREAPARAESPPGFYEPEMSIYGNQGGRSWPWKKQ